MRVHTPLPSRLTLEHKLLLILYQLLLPLMIISCRVHSIISKVYSIIIIYLIFFWISISKISEYSISPMVWVLLCKNALPNIALQLLTVNINCSNTQILISCTYFLFLPDFQILYCTIISHRIPNYVQLNSQWLVHYWLMIISIQLNTIPVWILKKVK